MKLKEKQVRDSVLYRVSTPVQVDVMCMDIGSWVVLYKDDLQAVSLPPLVNLPAHPSLLCWMLSRSAHLRSTSSPLCQLIHRRTWQKQQAEVVEILLKVK